MRDLRNHTKTVLDAVDRGEEVVLTRRGTPVAVITPINPHASVGSWLDALHAEEPVDTGWLAELDAQRREDDRANDRRDLL